MFFYAEQWPPISVVSTIHVYISLILHIAWGLLAAQLLLLYCLYCRIQLKGWSPIGTQYGHGREKEQWSNYTMVLKISVLDGA